MRLCRCFPWRPGCSAWWICRRRMRRGDCLAIPATGPVPRRAGYRLHRRSGRTQTPHPSEAVLRFRHHRHIPCSAKRLDHDHPHRDRALCLRRTAPPHRAAYANAIAIGNSAAASGITASPVARSTHSWRRGKQVAPPSTRIRRASTESRGRRNVGRGR